MIIYFLQNSNILAGTVMVKDMLKFCDFKTNLESCFDKAHIRIDSLAIEIYTSN